MGPTTRVGLKSDYFVPLPERSGDGEEKQSARANALDTNYFGVAKNGAAVQLGARLRKEKEVVSQSGDDKKHFKKKREKQRSGRGYD
jgi:large subunit GTPase 1